MKNLKVGDVVIAPEGCVFYLTAGKEYQLICDADEDGYFRIINDSGSVVYTGLTNSAHLNYQDWIIKSEIETTNLLKDFFTDCMLFKSKDTTHRYIGVFVWIDLSLLAVKIIHSIFI